MNTLNRKRYFLKTNLKEIKINKYGLRRLLKNKLVLELSFLGKRFLYFPIYWSAGIDFYSSLPFNAYQYQFNFFKRKFNNIKYCKLVEVFKKLNKLMKYKYRVFLGRHKNYSPQRVNLIWSYIYMYNKFFSTFYIDLYYLFQILKKKRQRMFYHLILTFNKNKLFVNLQNFKKKNYLFLSSGLFIKFFEKKKSFKKNKTIKLLMAKYIRKLFLISRIKNTILVVKKTPVFLLEIINLLNSPIAHKFVDPVEHRIIEEEDNDFLWIKFMYFIFLENKDFSLNKGKKKGRIKRKVLRKLIFENKVID